MRHQRRELGLNGRVVFVVRTDQRPVPFPATGFRWLNEQQHLTLEEVRGKPTEHSLGEEGPGAQQTPRESTRVRASSAAFAPLTLGLG